jgi:hypothetical protein
VHIVNVTTVDAASRRHKLLLSIRKYVVLVSSVSVPGIAPVSELFFRELYDKDKAAIKSVQAQTCTAEPVQHESLQTVAG